MTEIKELVDRLKAHEKRMEFLFDMIVALRDKQTDPTLHESLNSMKYVLSGRPPCVLEAASTIELLSSQVEELRGALAPFAQELGRFGIGNGSQHVELRLSGRKAIANLDLSVADFERARARASAKAGGA